jgi:putative oxidoreductase
MENTRHVPQKMPGCGILLSIAAIVARARRTEQSREQENLRMRSFEKLKPLALLLLRLALGGIFIYHGYPKLFGHTREAAATFVRLGFPGYFASISGAIEFFGGCLLVMGLFTRVAGLLLAGEMTIGLWRVHQIIKNPLAVHNYELPLSLAVSAFTLVALGGGLISFDHVLFREGGSPLPRKPRNRT